VQWQGCRQGGGHSIFGWLPSGRTVVSGLLSFLFVQFSSSHHLVMFESPSSVREAHGKFHFPNLTLSYGTLLHLSFFPPARGLFARLLTTSTFPSFSFACFFTSSKKERVTRVVVVVKGTERISCTSCMQAYRDKKLLYSSCPARRSRPKPAQTSPNHIRTNHQPYPDIRPMLSLAQTRGGIRYKRTL